MNYKKLGNTDINVSTICLGTMTWGEQNTQDEGFEQMNYALDQGVNFWDTAEIYSIPPKEETFGRTEEIIGNWFEKTKKRDKIILASKVCGPMREYVRGGGNQFGTRGWSVAHVRETFRPSSERMAAVRVTTRLEPVLASGMGGLAHPRSRSDPTAPDGAPRVPGGRAGAWVARWRPGAMTRSQAQLERHDLRSGRGGGGESRDRAHSAG